MAIFLVQHGKSLPKEKDPDQGLSREGVAETQSMSQLAADMNIQVERIIHSGKKRALQTAEILMKALEPEAGIMKGSGLAPLDDVASFASTLNSQEQVMIVGHLPFLERLVSYLVAGSAESPVIRFQNSAIVSLDVDNESERWVIRWVQFPRFI